MMKLRKIGMKIIYAENPAIGKNHPYLQSFIHDKHLPIDHYLSKEDKYMIYKLATSPEYSSGDVSSRLEIYDQILNPRKFTRSFSGTNRVVYTHKSEKDFLLKIALDDVGASDNLREYTNQEYLKPYIPKLFDVTPCGTIALMERVTPILSRDEFYIHANSIYDVITHLIGHGFVLEDIGTDFFMNWGIRKEFGPVLLDFPYIFRSNKERMRCISFNHDTHVPCYGKIGYDDGFNFLFCSKCGKRYAAKDVGTVISLFSEKRRSKSIMKSKRDEITVELQIGNTVYSKKISPDASVDYIADNDVISFVNSVNKKVNERINDIVKDNEPKQTNKPNIRKSESNPGFRHIRNIDDKLKPIMVELGKKFNFNPFDIPEMMEEYLGEYMEDHWEDYMEIKVVSKPASYRKKLSDEENDKYDERIENAFRLPNGKSFYYDIRSYVIDLYISKAFPKINEEKFYHTLEKGVEEYFIELEKANAFDDKRKNKDENKNENLMTNSLVEAIVSITNSDETFNFKKEKEEEKPKQIELKMDSPNSLGNTIVTDMAKDIIGTPGKLNSKEF